MAEDRSERKLATVLFADLAGSTALADEQDPERTRARLERFYDAMAGEIEAAGGTVEKFAGDAVMAAFGAPEALEDHAERALHTALAMQRRVEAGLTLRIGVNTGEVVAGSAREGSSFVSGDAVNVAARLEQAAESGEILAGERTAAAARGAFEFGPPRTIEAKGKPGGIRCRPVVRALSLMRTRGVGGLARAFVGRDDELARVQAAYRRSVERPRPVLVTVLGEAGLGKTRLMRELWESLAVEEPSPLCRTGRCLAYGEGITYWPLGEVLKEHVAILESDPPEEVRRRLGSREILGLTLGLDIAGELHPLAARDRLHAAWASFLSELASEQPLVVLIEDVHWAEPPLLDLLERAARDATGPLLLLTTSRPDFARAWDPRIDSETIWLEPLPPQTAATLVDELLASDLPPPVRDLVVERAEGNPFFVEEVLASLIDAGVLQRANGTWHAEELPPGFAIPDSVQAVLAARIDLLGDAEKAALQAAAVIGRTFWTGPVYELVAELEPDLSVLESRDFIRRRPTSSLEGEVEYVFKHALTRDVAYNGLTKARRARLHADFAEWLERLGEGRDEHAPLLAHHYAEAVRPDDVDVAWPDQGPELEALRLKAIEWLERAAEGAIARYELDDAVSLLERALSLETARDEQARLWRRLGRAHALRYDGENFVRAMQTALELVDDPRQRSETYAELTFEGAMRSGMWRSRLDWQTKEEWSARALAGVEFGSAPHVKALIGRAFWALPDADECARLGGELAEKLGDVELRSAAFDARAGAAFRAGDYDGAHTWAMRRFDFLPDLTNPDLIHDTYLSAIPAAAAIGRIREARRLAEELQAVVAGLTPHHRVHGIACTLEVEELAGNWHTIAALEADTERTVEANRDTPCVRNARSLLLCALANELDGRADRARELESAADEFPNEGFGATLGTPRARLALARAEFNRLEELLADDEWMQRQIWFSLPAAAAHLDALAVVGSAAEVKGAAQRLGKPGSYLEPFGLRALGVVHEDEALLGHADEAFRAMQLDWHAVQTGPLRTLRKRALG
jgi:class 3 adenylate cyclase/tetratricopeptide (TPR) repeat protein